MPEPFPSFLFVTVPIERSTHHLNGGRWVVCRVKPLLKKTASSLPVIQRIVLLAFCNSWLWQTEGRNKLLDCLRAVEEEDERSKHDPSQGPLINEHARLFWANTKSTKHRNAYWSTVRRCHLKIEKNWPPFFFFFIFFLYLFCFSFLLFFFFEKVRWSPCNQNRDQRDKKWKVLRLDLLEVGGEV